MANTDRLTNIKNRIKTFPDFPKPGILFKDIFPLFQHPSMLDDIVDAFAERITSKYQGLNIDMIVGIDSRGFLFGPQLANKLGCDFVPARKKGKLPGETIEISYSLEYGESIVEIQKYCLAPGKVAVIVDDLIATGGTMSAVHSLLTESQVKVLECQCIVELPELNGRAKLPKDCSLFCLVEYNKGE